MEKEKVLEIEYQEVFDEVAVRIKNINNNFFANGFYKEDVEKYKCSFIESPTDLEERIIWLYDNIYLSDNNIYCYCEETINKIKEFVDYVNEEYGILKRWRAEEAGDNYFYISGTGEIRIDEEGGGEEDYLRYELGNYFKTDEEARKIINSKEWKDFWAKVRAGEIE
ncbi:hypothetical protein [Fusobacterium vincentii]|uniref:hypothetical protein n=1 Tax=Fusobacterium vincentii TaxID=155615 RepID=UPI002B2B97C5|nr:hypothetical protein FVTDC_06540 [Fusobacterium vincentii]